MAKSAWPRISVHGVVGGSEHYTVQSGEPSPYAASTPDAVSAASWHAGFEAAASVAGTAVPYSYTPSFFLVFCSEMWDRFIQKNTAS